MSSPNPSDFEPSTPLQRPARQGLYQPDHEHDACGVGIIANINGKRTHEIVEQGLDILINLGHRGACGCDPRTGDGAGILIQLPAAFMTKVARGAGIRLPEAGRFGVAMVFLPQDPGLRKQSEAVVEGISRAEGLRVLGWRDVPVNPLAAGWLAREV
ncbi:MAG: hypothetical protein HY678_10000, partial [Chloroflexi bacterium]|nr:hypothetical protein [Chloroflexota bacterium]